ncbi:MAG: HNH endonuclease [Prevotella sp.]
MSTEWSSVIGYEGLYEVSNDGRVRTVRHKTNGHEIPPKELAINIYKSQRYARVRLYKKGKPKDHMVHRLVAEAFIPNPKNKPQVNHIDGNRKNNRADNLEWCTQAENNRHAIDNGLQDPSRMIEATKKKVMQLTRSGKLVKEWDSLTEAATTLGLQVSNISHCCNGRIGSTGGYKWVLSSES